MSRKYFGTDGVRGVANQGLTPEFCFRLGFAAGSRIVATGQNPRVVVGRDTRRSGSMLGAALASGFCSAGVDVVTLGVCPTGGISYAARTGDYAMAAVISASHNPAPDNGIKLIAHDGRKVSDEVEAELEAALDQDLPANRAVGAGVGRILNDRTDIDRYVDYLTSLVPEGLEGMSIAMDCAHGAAFELAPLVFHRLGAVLAVMGVEPSGININEEGGATKPQTIQEATKRLEQVIGIAFDGDADRAVFADREGRLINGDRTMAIWGRHWRERLEPMTIVGTVMSNGGFERYLTEQGIALERVNVGDKYVSAKLSEIGGKVGGEQSGHIIFPELGPTGDGLITALEVCRVLKLSGKSAADFYEEFENWPQMLVNVSVTSKEALAQSEPVQEAIRSAETALAGHGRINVRPSGTQPMIRVMVEADDAALRDQTVAAVVNAMEKHVGGSVYSRVDLTHALGD